jgi:hypothetical protein
MKMTPNQINHLVELIFKSWHKANIPTFKVDEKKAFDRAVSLIKEEFNKEAELDREVNRKLDELERTNAGEFQRHKMFPMLKAKLAKERKIVL